MIILKNSLGCDLPIRTEKDFPISGVEFIDITPLIMEKDIFDKIIQLFVLELQNKSIDYIVSPEARGYLFASCIANQLNVGLIPVRKASKLPPSVVGASFSSTKEYGSSLFDLPKLVNDSYQNHTFYLLDDIYATGNTFYSIKEAIKNLDGIVVGEGAVIKINGLSSNPNLFSLIDVEEE